MHFYNQNQIRFNLYLIEYFWAYCEKTARNAV